MTDKPVSKAKQLCLDQLKAGKTRAWIAGEVGYGASHIRRYLLGHYDRQDNKKLEDAIVARFDRRICPHDGQEKKPEQCQRVALRGRQHGFPDAENLWLACQQCPHKPIKEGGSK